MTLWPRLARRPHADQGHDEEGRHSRPGRLLGYLDGFRQDIRYGCRMLAKNPAFTIVAVISLAVRATLQMRNSSIWPLKNAGG